MNISTGLYPGVQKQRFQHRRISSALSPSSHSSCVFVSGIAPSEVVKVTKEEQDQTMVQVAWGPVFDSKQSAFVHQTFGIFMQLQQAEAEKPITSSLKWNTPRSKSSAAQSLLNRENKSLKGIHASQAYRNAIKKHMSSLKKRVDEDVDHEIRLFEAIHCIWHLAEILHVHPEKAVGESLLLWLNEHFPATSYQDVEEVLNFMAPHEHPQFWDLLKKCILRGQFRYALQLLSRTPISKSASSIVTSAGSLVEILQRLLREMPLPKNHASRHEFENKWREWKKECDYYMEESILNSLVSTKQEFIVFQEIFSILVGDADALEKACDNDWKGHLVSMAIFSYPLIQVADLGDILAKLTKPKEPSVLDQILLSIFEDDLTTTFRLCSQLNWWLVAHLTDVLEKSGKVVQDEEIVSSTTGLTCSLKEWFLLGYVDSIQSEDTWQISLEYLNHCPVLGHGYIKEQVLRIPFDSDMKLRKLLHFCSKYGFEEEKRALLRIAGRSHYLQDHMGEALMYYAEAKETRIVSKIADKLLMDYIVHKDHRGFTLVVDGLPHAVLYESSERLAFLARYREFHNYYSNKEYKKAAQLLCLLLTSGIAPKLMWPTLLLDSVPLLEGEEIAFSMEDTSELMRCLEEILSSHKKAEYLTVLQYPKQDRVQDAIKALEVVRFALVRNLARTMM